MAGSDVAVKFSADLSGLQAGVDKARGLFDQFASNVRSNASAMTASIGPISDKVNATSDSVGDFAKKAGAAFGAITLGATVMAAAGVAALEQVGRSAVAMVEPLRAAAGSFDQTLQSMSATNALAGRAGTSMTALGQSFQNLQVKAREGDAQVVTSLGAIGLKVSDVANLSQDELAVKLTQAFSTAKDSSNKTAAGVGLLGDQFAKLIPQLDRGADAMKELQAANDRAGLKIGPELAAKIQGTMSLFQAFTDQTNELSKTFSGGVLVMFQQLKPAIDGLTQSFTTVVQNVTSLVRWFSETDGAGRKNIATTGALAEAAKKFSVAIIDATTWVQTFAVKSAQGLADYGMSFQGLGNVAGAFFKDLVTLATTAADKFKKAFQDAIDGVMKMFGDVSSAFSAARSFDLSGVRAAYDSFKTHAVETSGKITSSFDGAFAGTKKAADDMQRGAKATADALNPLLDKIAKQGQAAKDLIDRGGKLGSGGPKQTRNPGSSKVADDGGSDRDAISAAQKEIDGQIRVLQRGLQEKLAIYEADVQAFGGSETQKVLKVKAAIEDEYQGELALLQKRKEIAGQTLAQRQDTENKIADLVVKHRITMLQVEVDGIKNLQAKWSEALGAITQSFNSQMRGVLAGTMSLGQAFKNMAGDMVLGFVQACEQMAVKYAATELGITTAKLLGLTERQAAETAANATSIATMAEKALSAIGSSVAQVFAGVSGFLAPEIGPAAPAVAGGVAASVGAVAAGMIPSYDVGSFRVGRDHIAQLHADEMIVPARSGVAPEFRQFMANGGFKGAAGGGPSIGDIHIHAPGVYDTAGLHRMLKGSGGVLAKTVAETVAKHPSLRPKY